MANGILSFPFRLTATGAAATAGYGTDQEISEAIAVLTLTQLGERPMAPGFGIPDPVFSSIDTGDVQVGLADHGPAGVTIQSVTATPFSETMSRHTISWVRDRDEQDYR